MEMRILVIVQAKMQLYVFDLLCFLCTVLSYK